MSRIDELIARLCPEGVEFRKLGEICKIETGKLNANAAVHDACYVSRPRTELVSKKMA